MPSRPEIFIPSAYLEEEERRFLLLGLQRLVKTSPMLGDEIEKIRKLVAKLGGNPAFM